MKFYKFIIFLFLIFYLSILFYFYIFRSDYTYVLVDDGKRYPYNLPLGHCDLMLGYCN